jgi:diguanylate cyclase (GGDEF)-like protein/PAS domain S-box-containing protein
MAERMASDDIEVITTDKPKLNIEESLRLPDGRNIWVIANKMPLHDKNGKVIGIMGITYDINNIKMAAIQLETILDSFPYKAWLKDKEGRFVAVNELLAKSIHKSKVEMIGKTDLDIYPKEYAKKFIEDDLKIIESKKDRFFQEISFSGNRPKLHETYKSPIINEFGEVIGTAGYTRDISKLQKELSELTRLNKLFSAVIDNIPIMLFIKDAKNLRFTVINKVMEELLGLSRKDILGKTDHDLFPKKQADFFVKKDREALKNKALTLIEEETISAKDKIVTLDTKKIPLFDENGNPICLIGISEDITEKKQMEKTIKELAYYDEITQLPNRYLFRDRFEIASEHAKRDNKKMMIAMLDFNKFKIINDEYGHNIGDKLLKSFAKRAKIIMRKTDTISRFGGDEFLFIISDFTNLEDMEKFAEKILKVFKNPFHIDDLELHIQGSMGISIFPDDSENRSDLVRYADYAMYEAKKKEKNAYEFYHEAKKNNSNL